MRWLVGERLFTVLQDAAPTGVRDADPAFWLLRLDALRLANRPDQFDEAAIDYCVTYEVSPPSWERAQLQGAHQRLAAVHALAAAVGGRARCRPASSSRRSATTPSAPVQVAASSCRASWSATSAPRCASWTSELGNASIVNVSCTKLIRVDFIAAGDLLNWVLARRGENRIVSFVDAHRLVALFFGAMGINEHAKVKVRVGLIRVVSRLEGRRIDAATSTLFDGHLPRHHHRQRAPRPRTSRSAATARSRSATSSSRPARARCAGCYRDQVLAGFAGATADAFTLFERFEAKLEKHQGHLVRAAIELTKDWRTDRVLRRLEAMLAVADKDASLIITGNGDVLEPEHGIIAIGSGGAYAQAAARALLEHTELAPAEIVKRVARDRRRHLHLHQPEPHDRDARRTCMKSSMTPQEIVSELDRHIVGQKRRQARGRHRAAQPLAAPAGRRPSCATRSRRRTS